MPLMEGGGLRFLYQMMQLSGWWWFYHKDIRQCKLFTGNWVRQLVNWNIPDVQEVLIYTIYWSTGLTKSYTNSEIWSWFLIRRISVFLWIIDHSIILKINIEISHPVPSNEWADYWMPWSGVVDERINPVSCVSKGCHLPWKSSFAPQPKIK